MNPKVSVIVPHYRAGDTLGRCLESVTRQSFDSWECLVIDDNPAADYSDHVRRKFNDARFRWYDNPANLGVSTTRNIGNRLACGDYIVVLDADDESSVNRLHETVTIFEKYPNVGLIAGAAQPALAKDQDDRGATTAQTEQQFPYIREVKQVELLLGCPFVHSCVAYRRSLTLTPFYITYNPSLLVAHDYDIYRQLAEANQLMALSSSVYSYRHETGFGLMNRLINRMIEESVMIKCQIAKHLLPDLTYNQCTALSYMLTYSRFVTQSHRDICEQIIGTVLHENELVQPIYQIIKSRFEEMKAPL